jgi:glutaredoxin-like protein NrdH
MNQPAPGPGVTVYTLPNCVQCRLTTNELTKRGVTYTTVQLTPGSAAEAHVKALGHLAAPVVVAPDGAHWSGFLPGQITQHIAPPATTS